MGGLIPYRLPSTTITTMVICGLDDDSGLSREQLDNFPKRFGVFLMLACIRYPTRRCNLRIRLNSGTFFVSWPHLMECSYFHGHLQEMHLYAFAVFLGNSPDWNLIPCQFACGVELTRH